MNLLFFELIIKVLNNVIKKNQIFVIFVNYQKRLFLLIKLNFSIIFKINLQIF